MDEKKYEEAMEQEEKDEGRDLSQLNSIERFYERFRGVPLRRIDTFIGICIAVIILVVIIGMLDGRGII